MKGLISARVQSSSSQALAGFHYFLEDTLRCLRGDFFDVHAAVGRGHEDVLARGSVEHDAQVEFTLDRKSLFDEQALHDAAFRSGLMRYEAHAEDLFGDARGILGVLRHLDAAAFAASAGVNLRLHDYAPADLLRRSRSFFHRERDLSARNRDVVLGQDRLGLILMNFHGLLVLVWRESQTNSSL